MISGMDVVDAVYKSDKADKISIIIPAYNEEMGIADTIKELVYCLNEHCMNYEIIIIDDGSTDDTGNIIKSISKESADMVHVLSHSCNRGYGSAIKSGVKRARGQYIAWYDADGQHRPEDLIKLISTIIDNDYDYCIGIREAGSYEETNRKLGKWVLRTIVNFFAREKTKDFNSGMRIFKREVLQRYLPLLPRRFGASTVTTLLMQELNYYGGGVDICTRERIGKSSVKQLRDGMNTISLIFNIILLFRPMQIFGNLGIVTIIMGGIYGLYKAFLNHQGFPTLAAIIVIFGIQMIIFGIIVGQISKLRLERLEEH